MLTFAKEAATQRIDLPEDNPDLIAKMMDFLYLFDYDDGQYSGLSNRKDHAYRSARYTNAEMYALGEKYNLQGLKKTAAAKFETALHSETRGTPILPLITLIYASTPENDRGLRDLILPVALVNAKILSSLPGFKSMIVENAELPRRPLRLTQGLALDARQRTSGKLIMSDAVVAGVRAADSECVRIGRGTVDACYFYLTGIGD